MKTGIEVYLRRVRRNLRCGAAQRKQLLAGLEAELREAFPEGTSSVDQVLERFDAPEAVAAEIQSTLPAGAEAAYHRGKRRKLVVGLVACAAVAALVIGYLIWFATIDVHYVDSEIIIGTILGGLK